MPAFFSLTLACLLCNTIVAEAGTSRDNGRLRPQFHYSPPKNFMNDPNGLFCDEIGLWHMYYQYNHDGLIAGNQSWGHATSADLYTWETHPVAILPSDVDSLIFSGSIVVDVNNTSTLFPTSQTNGVVAIYTAHEVLGSVWTQSQHIAYSTDGGYTFTKYENNPIITSSLSTSAFRDPKVYWHHETQKWVMIIGHAEYRRLSIYTSPNLIDWVEVSYIEHIGLIGVNYECAGLERIPVVDEDGGLTEEYKYVLVLSINPGAPHGGSFTEYFIGNFNGTHFELMDMLTRPLDFGTDCYAAQYWHNTLPVMIAWASNWLYTNLVPTGGLEGWRSIMTLPRVTYLKHTTSLEGYPRGWVLTSYPYDLSKLLSWKSRSIMTASSCDHNGPIRKPADSGWHFPNVSSYHLQELWQDNSGSYFFNVTLMFQTSSPSTYPIAAPGNFSIRLYTTNPGESLTFGFYTSGDFFINRGGLKGFQHDLFTERVITYAPFHILNHTSATMLRTDEDYLEEQQRVQHLLNSEMLEPGTGSLRKWEMIGFWDKSVLEVYINGGEDVGTVVGYPAAPFDAISFGIDGFEGGEWMVDIWEMKK